jgi:hypothetical protein
MIVHYNLLKTINDLFLSLFFCLLSFFPSANSIGLGLWQSTIMRLCPTHERAPMLSARWTTHSTTATERRHLSLSISRDLLYPLDLHLLVAALSQRRRRMRTISSATTTTYRRPVRRPQTLSLPFRTTMATPTVTYPPPPSLARHHSRFSAEHLVHGSPRGTLRAMTTVPEAGGRTMTAFSQT